MVFLDFGGEVLWRLLFFKKEVGRGAVAPLPRATLIENCLAGTKISTVSLKEEFRKKHNKAIKRMAFKLHFCHSASLHFMAKMQLKNHRLSRRYVFRNTNGYP